MINLHILSDSIYDEFSKHVGSTGIQILSERTLGQMEQEKLELPRLIFGFTSYNSSDYHYMRTENHTDMVKQIVDFNSNVGMAFRVYSDEANANTVFDVVNELYNFYQNPFIKKLDGKMVVNNISGITMIPIHADDLATIGYSFTLTFNMTEELTSEHGYAEKAIIEKFTIKT